MAKKTNYSVNGSSYYRVNRKIGLKEDGSPRYKQFYGTSRQDAIEKYNSYMQGNLNGIKDYDKLSFEEIFEKWFNSILRPSVADSSYNRYEQTWRLWIRPGAFVKMPLIAITGLHIQEHIVTIDSKNTANAALHLVKQFFKYCLTNRYIQFDPTIGTKRLRIPTSTKKKLLTFPEAKAVIDAMADNFALFPFVFVMLTGLRQGEMMALTHADVDLINGFIRVNKSLNRTKVGTQNKVVVKEPKNASSIRSIPILEELKPYIKTHIANEKQKHLKNGVPFERTDFFFTQPNLSPLRGDRLTALWKDVQVELGMDPVDFHALRHTFCTFLAKKGVPLTTASKLMGHSDIETTAHVYTHVDSGDMTEAIAKLSILL